MKQLEYKTIYVDGMTCVSCEKRINSSINNLNGIKDVEVHQNKNLVKVTYDNSIVSLDEIHDVINSNGYVVTAKASSKFASILITLSIIISISITYFYFLTSVNFDFIPQIRQSMGYGTLFIVGSLTSLHCLAMCGGINISQCSQYTSNNEKGKLLPSFLYNLGRVISYTIIGGIIGGIGSVISLSGQIRGYVTIIISILMIIMALKMLKLINIQFKPIKLPKWLRSVHRLTTNKGPFIVGLFNGFMPCGPLQSMQLYALGTGSILIGALSMFYFSIGTVPLMFGLGAVSTLLNQRFSSKLMKYSAFLVFLLALSMFSRGASLAGIQLPFQSPEDLIVAEEINSEQVIYMDLEPNRYQPIQVKKGVPVTWVINVNSANLNGCNNPMSIPEYEIEATLVPGENTITFTPTEEGRVVYTCWMGMITSYIDIVDE